MASKMVLEVARLWLYIPGKMNTKADILSRKN